MIKKTLFFIFITSIAFANEVDIKGDLISRGLLNRNNNEKSEDVASNNKESSKKKVDINSIMIRKENAIKIYDILDYLNKNKVEYSNGTSKKETKKKDNKIALNSNAVSVFLNAIMYISDNNWTLWVNGVKINNINNGESEIIVKDISNNLVKFLWKVSKTKWEIINKENNVSPDFYKVNENDEVEMEFSLRPNQTFVPYLNKVLEGNLKQDNKSEEIIEEELQEEDVIEQDELNDLF